MPIPTDPDIASIVWLVHVTCATPVGSATCTAAEASLACVLVELRSTVKASGPVTVVAPESAFQR